MVPRLETFRFEGGKELERALREMSEQAGNGRTGKAAMRRAALKSLDPFVSLWKQLAPVLSGQYRESIHAGTKLTRRQAGLAKREGKSNLEVYAGTADPAGLMAEFGLANNPAQPSGVPAWDQTQHEVLERLGTGAWEHLRKSAERLQRRLARRR